MVFLKEMSAHVFAAGLVFFLLRWLASFNGECCCGHLLRSALENLLPRACVADETYERGLGSKGSFFLDVLMVRRNHHMVCRG